MLVLTRKHQEKIRIGDHIMITVLKTKGKTVRLGIEAPTEVPVIRGELSFEGQAVEWQEERSRWRAGAAALISVETSHADRVRQLIGRRSRSRMCRCDSLRAERALSQSACSASRASR